MAELSLTLKNDFGELAGAADRTNEFLAAHEAPDDVAFAANLAIEELVTNCVKYGYDDTAAHEIEITLTLENKTLTIVLHDDGHEFNPFDQPEPDIDAPPEEREIGGLGIHFVRNMLDECAYHRDGTHNVITLVKRWE